MARKGRKTIHKGGHSVIKLDGPERHAGGPESRVKPLINVHPAPHHNGEAIETEQKPNTWVQGAWKVVPIAVSICAVVVSLGSRDAAERSARAAEESAKAAQRNADIAEQALKTMTEKISPGPASVGRSHEDDSAIGSRGGH